jgi:hypothetical protein
LLFAGLAVLPLLQQIQKTLQDMQQQNFKFEAKVEANLLKHGKELAAISMGMQELLDAQGSTFEHTTSPSLAYYLSHEDGQPLLAFEQKLSHLSMSGEEGTIEPFFPMGDPRNL